MQFAVDGHEYAGTMPTGSDGLDLFEKVAATLKAFGYGELALAPGLTAEELKRFIPLARDMASSQLGRQLILQTLRGWTVDGTLITSEVYSVLFTSSRRFVEPGAAAVRIWSEAGFFHVPEVGPVTVAVESD